MAELLRSTQPSPAGACSSKPAATGVSSMVTLTQAKTRLKPSREQYYHHLMNMKLDYLFLCFQIYCLNINFF
ncbi:hypothetical protein L6164_030921 [Bauhinia variegata]|uniref:Uncharacterized protein n=1 Tax=Bauhinia variegata TaxID=167791 RepID=A0ACB9LDR3_BAUVA|nr:hypothetical protein L6164_030921 [Bauhinia variegata]